MYFSDCSTNSSFCQQGILQPDMWGVQPSDLWDWSALREKICQNSVRNSLLVAPMPTASTSQILGNNECFEPYTSNIYSRRVLRWESFCGLCLHQSDMFSKVEFFFILVIMAYLTPTVMRHHTSFCLLVMISGEFVVVNKHLLSDLTNMGLWTSELKNQVIYHNGSIQQIEGIPENLKKIYR